MTEIIVPRTYTQKVACSNCGKKMMVLESIKIIWFDKRAIKRFLITCKKCLHISTEKNKNTYFNGEKQK